MGQLDLLISFPPPAGEGLACPQGAPSLPLAESKRVVRLADRPQEERQNQRVVPSETLALYSPLLGAEAAMTDGQTDLRSLAGSKQWRPQAAETKESSSGWGQEEGSSTRKEPVVKRPGHWLRAHSRGWGRLESLWGWGQVCIPEGKPSLQQGCYHRGRVPPLMVMWGEGGAVTPTGPLIGILVCLRGSRAAWQRAPHLEGGWSRRSLCSSRLLSRAETEEASFKAQALRGGLERCREKLPQSWPRSEAAPPHLDAPPSQPG